MTISFFLSRPKSESETSIYATICYGGQKFKYYTGESILPEYWNKKTKTAKQTAKFPENPEFNQRLRDINSKINKAFLDFKNQNGESPNPKTFRVILDQIIKKIEPENEKAKSFIPFFKELIEQAKKGVRLNLKTGKPLSKYTINTFGTIYKHLIEFQSQTKRIIEFETIDLEFYKDYTEFLMKGKELDKRTKKLKTNNLSTNTIGKHIQVIKLIMTEATEMGLTTNFAFRSKRFAKMSEKSDSIYLDQKEVNELANLDLSNNKRLEAVRDLFLIGCYTGLRYSDFSQLTPEHISDGFIEITQAKTEKAVVIPIDERIESIISKYEGRLPPAISNQKTNDYLKEIGPMIPSLQSKTSSTITKGGVKLTRTFERWELLTTHTARRSFATNEFLAGTPILEIMAITGHRTESAFLSYIKLTQRDHAINMKRRWTERKKGLLKAV
jgi:hypothetical protein